MASRKLTHIILAVLLLSAIPVAGAHAATPTAAQILDKTAKTLTSAKSATIHFAYTASSAHSNGFITISSKKFTLSLGNMAIWYNGTLQWALNRSENEVSLTRPTAAETLETNPFAILTSYKQHYTPTLAKASKSEYTVTLRPKSRNAQITSATIRINAANYQPKALTLRLSDGSTVSATVTSVSTGSALPASYFEYNARANPQIELIDLR